MPTVLHDSRAATKAGGFKWVNTVIGNVKTSLLDVCHAVRPQHLPRYLAEFESRFNRRFPLHEMIPKLIKAAANTAPIPYRLLSLAEV